MTACRETSLLSCVTQACQQWPAKQAQVTVKPNSSSLLSPSPPLHPSPPTPDYPTSVQQKRRCNERTDYCKRMCRVKGDYLYRRFAWLASSRKFIECNPCFCGYVCVCVYVYREYRRQCRHCLAVNYNRRIWWHWWGFSCGWELGSRLVCQQTATLPWSCGPFISNTYELLSEKFQRARGLRGQGFKGWVVWGSKRFTLAVTSLCIEAGLERYLPCESWHWWFGDQTFWLTRLCS